MEKRFFKFWAGIALLAILNLIFFDMSIFNAPETLQIQYTPDDAYYYLSLARNFANLHSWTFDSGISQTSGFHPLLAYLLVLSYKTLQPGVEEFYANQSGHLEHFCDFPFQNICWNVPCNFKTNV